jgi:RNA methyltransferase, TrmH family
LELTVITSPPPRTLGRHSERLSRLRRLVRSGEPGIAVVDGRKLVLELLDRGADVIELYATAAALEATGAAAVSVARSHPPQIFLVEPPTLERIAPTSHTQGLVALVRHRPAATAAEGIVVYLDEVQESGNVGAAVRCAAALGASGVACSESCGNPFSAKAVRASAGQSLLFPVQDRADLAELAGRFVAAGGLVAAAVGSGGTPVPAWRPRLPLLLALGNEGRGPSASTLSLCQERITIPLAGAVESLNVAVAAGVLLAGLAGLVPSPILDRSR